MPRPLFLLVVSAHLVASAQEPERPRVDRGTADKSLLRGKFSVAFDWGASFATQSALTGPPGLPLYAGGTVSFWVVDWFLLDAHASHAFNNQRTAVLLGPRFRTLTWPISASIGLRSGIIYQPALGPRFGVSPIAAIDMIFSSHFLAGLGACVDVPVSGSGPSVRVGLELGWRF